MTAGVAVIDSGALPRVESDRVLRAMVRQLVERGWDVTIPSVTLSETMTGRAADAPVHRVINSFGTVDTDRATARYAGLLRFRAARPKGRVSSGIDAIVAAHGVLERRRVILFTTDPADLTALTHSFEEVSVERV